MRTVNLLYVHILSEVVFVQANNVPPKRCHAYDFETSLIIQGADFHPLSHNNQTALANSFWNGQVSLLFLPFHEASISYVKDYMLRSDLSHGLYLSQVVPLKCRWPARGDLFCWTDFVFEAAVDQSFEVFGGLGARILGHCQVFASLSCQLMVQVFF